MKTQHLRADKTCLNCGAEVPERFCSYCGQENVDTKESFGHLVGHFFQDITHYDSKFLLTLKYLFFYPGFLTKQYITGHRMAFVNPIRLYVFTSFIFFLLLGMVNHENGEVARQVQDSIRIRSSSIVEEKRTGIHAELAKATTRQDSIELEKTLRKLEFQGNAMLGGTLHTAAEYDSVQKSLTPAERDPYWDRKISLKMLQLREKYGDRAQEVIIDKFTHNYPKMMFILLPFFALILYWLFASNKLYYAEHAIFSIHIHTFIFLLSVVTMLLNMLLHYDDIYAWMLLIVFIYYIFALRNTYRKSFSGALWRGTLSLMIYFIGSLLVLLGFVMIILIFA